MIATAHFVVDAAGKFPGGALGIDFGNTTSSVAAMTSGSPQILLNDIFLESTPSCVRVLSKDDVTVGTLAERSSLMYPDCTIRNVKKILGMPCSEILANNVSITSKEAAGWILRELKRIAEQKLIQSERAVIGVPSYFNKEQQSSLVYAGSQQHLQCGGKVENFEEPPFLRKTPQILHHILKELLTKSCNIAGFTSVKLVNETSAAAVCYSSKIEMLEHIGIVDIGGGGGSVAVAEVSKNNVRVLASSVVQLPGGEDINERMCIYLLKEISSVYGVHLTSKRDLETLRLKWEEAKQKLSRNAQCNISCYFSDIERDVELSVTRETMENEISDIIGNVTTELMLTIKKSKVTVINTLVLSGCSTRVPKLQESLRAALPGTRLYRGIHPEKCVAEGAALLGAGLVTLRDCVQVNESVSVQSDVTTTSKRGKKNSNQEWLNKTTVDNYICANFNGYAGFDAKFEKGGLNEACKEIAAELFKRCYQVECDKAKLDCGKSFVKMCIYNARKSGGPTTENISTSFSNKLEKQPDENENVEKTNTFDEKFKPPGIINEGQTCYLNASLQCLFSVKEIVDALNQWCPGPNPTENQSFCASLKLVSAKWKDSSELISLKCMKKDFESVIEMEFNKQNDAQECFSRICSVLNHVLASSKVFVVRETFEGILRRQITCLECKTSRYGSEDPFWMYPVGIVKDGSLSPNDTG
ncbi:chaperone protein DnaK-like [Frankliniella occidentalis]|uniref:Chaperone protein DnaK-like n=1 Tax=Frankliniella occidentalis TaxID=133901 RepID=A0A9C6X894_FRAOC|nr:chaperone protein DnaK-like [Frankliniella occidentalis]